MKPEEFKHYKENVDAILTHRELQDIYYGNRRSWRRKLRGMTVGELQVAGKEAVISGEKLSKKLFELPEGTPNAGEVLDVTKERAPAADSDVTYHVRTLDTEEYGKINIYKWQDSVSEGEEFWPEYDPKEPGAIVAQVLRYDEDSLLDIVDDNGELDISENVQDLFPTMDNFSSEDALVGVLDALDTMEHIAKSFGIETTATQ